MHRTILVPLDGSDVARRALEEVTQIGLAPDATVVLLQVVDTVAHIIAVTSPAGFPLDGGGFYLAETAEAVVQSQQQQAERELAAARDRLQQAGVKRVETRIVQGVPGPTVVEIAEAIHADLIVIGTHGRGGMKRAVLGSVADHVVRHAPGIPVLLVRPEPQHS